MPTNELQLLNAVEEKAAAQYWEAELGAQRRLRTVNALWDAINRSSNRLATALGNFHPSELMLPAYKREIELPHEIRVASPSQGVEHSQPSPYSELLQLSAGWRLDQCEFRFIAINPDTFYVSLHLSKPENQSRAILEGNVTVQFTGSNTFQRIDASRLELRTRSGPPAFTEMFHEQVASPAGSYFIDPLIVWDLDADGQLEVVLAAANRVFRRQQDGSWRRGDLRTEPPGLLFTAILGDFSGDGITDFLGATFEGLTLYEGTSDGRFPGEAKVAWKAEPRLRYGQCLTTGDVDNDGDLDLFLGQYKPPYSKGQMPFPYFDANDGYPSHLLLNDGQGNFTDGTQKAGLAAKRGRRVYSASMVDLDRDNDLDLLLTSDFAGLDAFENKGAGVFWDATAKWFSETRAFGMGHTLADFNRDGLLDVLMIGMNSPTADRLNELQRPYEGGDAGMRRAVSYGNRLFFGNENGTFRQNALSERVARTGWSWGSAAGDLDNDGYPELYIANGHESRSSVEDYEPEFWLHDIYVGNSQENSLAESYFRQKYGRTRGQGQSYGGYEKNRLFLNAGGTNFIEAAHLFGVAMEQDSRNIALQDLDNDGKLDLIVTTFEVHPEVRQTIRFFRNELPSAGNQIQVALKDAKFTGAQGAVFSGRTNAFVMVSGESYRAQLPLKAHIGIGTASNSTVRVVSGTDRFRLDSPKNAAGRGAPESR